MKGQNKQSTKQSVSSWAHHNTFCRKSLLWTLATLQSWQPLGFTPRTDRNCGEPGKYTHGKCDTLQTDMKHTGESDPRSLDEHQACNLSGGFQGATCTDPCTLLACYRVPQVVSPKELFQCKERLTSLSLYKRTVGKPKQLKVEGQVSKF